MFITRIGIVFTNYLGKSILDDRFKLEVYRTARYEGKLILTDTEDDNKILLEKDDGIMYGAMFGPDVVDVAEWQDMAVEVVDNL